MSESVQRNRGRNGWTEEREEERPFPLGKKRGQGEKSTAVMAVDEEERQCVRPCRGKERGGGREEVDKRGERREKEKSPVH